MLPWPTSSREKSSQRHAPYLGTPCSVPRAPPPPTPRTRVVMLGTGNTDRATTEPLRLRSRRLSTAPPISSTSASVVVRRWAAALRAGVAPLGPAALRTAFVTHLHSRPHARVRGADLHVVDAGAGSRGSARARCRHPTTTATRRYAPIRAFERCDHLSPRTRRMSRSARVPGR